MKKPNEIKSRNPEAQIQDKIIRMLRFKEWTVMSTHGNMYQHGFPDLYCCHPLHGQRWVEVKRPNPKDSRFTAAQTKYFPLLSAAGIGIWVLTGSTTEDYEKLFKKPNWKAYYTASKQLSRYK